MSTTEPRSSFEQEKMKLRLPISARTTGLILFASVFLVVHAGSIRADATSRSALDFHATTLEDKPYHGLSLRGKIVLLDFWAVWCPPCIKAFPILSRLEQELVDFHFKVLGIAVFSGDAMDVAIFVDKHDVRYEIVVGDEDLVEQFGVVGYPTYFLITPDGTIAEKYVGDHPDLYKQIADDVKAIYKRWDRKEEQ